MDERNDERNDEISENNVRTSPKTTRRVARQECELLEHQVEIPDFEDVILFFFLYLYNKNIFRQEINLVSENYGHLLDQVF